MAGNSNPRPGKISRPARNVNLVVSVMRNFGNENGCTVGNITEYIANCCEKATPKREVVAALKRGVEFGIVDRKHGRYYLMEADEKHRGRLSHRNHDTSFAAADELGERGGVRKSGKAKKSGKSKDSGRRKKGSKRAPGTGRNKSMKKTRFARSLKSYELSDYYQNPGYKTSGVSSMDSMEFYEGEDRRA